MEEIIHETLQSLLELMHIPFTKIDIEEDADGHYNVNIHSEESNRLIGYHGNTLHAVQHLLKILLFKRTEQQFTLTLDVDHYRQRQEENVLNLADQKVDQLRRFNIPQKLPPMSPYFRRLVHLHLTKPEFQGIVTESEGDGDFRAVVISMA